MPLLFDFQSPNLAGVNQSRRGQILKGSTSTPSCMLWRNCLAVVKGMWSNEFSSACNAASFNTYAVVPSVLLLTMCILYAGIFYTTAIIGPAIGYIAGGKLLEIYCDVGSVNLDESVLNILFSIYTPYFIKKTTPCLIAHNFGKCWAIFNFFSPSDSAEIV